jgi:hexosaminidase
MFLNKSSVFRILIFLVLLMYPPFLHSSDSISNILLKNVPRGKSIQITWELINNPVNAKNGQKGYLSRLLIRNLSDAVLKGNNWTIYFHQTMHVSSGTESNNVKITHINGDYYKLEPTPEFIPLIKGEVSIIEYLSDILMIKMQGAPHGFYIVYSDDNGNEFEPENILDIKKVLIRPEQTRMHLNDNIPYPTGAYIYAQNKEINHADKNALTQVLPTPYFLKVNSGKFRIRKELHIAYNFDFKNEAKFLAEKLEVDLALIVNLSEGDNGDIVLKKKTLNSDYTGIGKYEVTISTEGVIISGENPVSVFYGIQSFRAAIPIEAYQKPLDDIYINNLFIHDEARFEYRGMHLDVARHFNSKAVVLKLLDLMAFYKLNKFHFHITDDEGWRLEIPGLPELTDVGAKRGHTKDELDMLIPALGSGPFTDEGTYGSGFYTTSDFIEILKYAKARHIEVIPEIDFPGHARAAIVSMKSRYERYLKAGDRIKAEMYMLHDPMDVSRYRSVQRFNDNVICPCQKSTYKFIDKVLDEVSDMYKKAGLELKNLHIGGDEVPHPMGDDLEHGAWIGSPICQELLSKNKEYSKPEELYYYFTERFNSILWERGIETGGWEEIAFKKTKNSTGDFAIKSNDKLKRKGVVPYTWNNIWGWGGEDRAYKLANDGYKVVIAGASNNYYALSYNKNPLEPGYYWGGFVDTKRSWQQVPMNIYNEEATTRDGNLVEQGYKDDMVRLTKEGARNIKGIQGQMWSETVIGEKMMEYYIFPKILGLVERAWAKDPDWTSINNDSSRVVAQDKDWSKFASRLGYFELPRLNYLNGGVNYRIAAPGVVVENGILKVNMNFPGFICRYTTDGTEPNLESAIYLKPIAVEGNVVKVIAFSGRGDVSLVTEVVVRK